MDTREWAARAEIVASFAVVVTLAFVVFEVRQNTAALERQNELERQLRINAPYLQSIEFREIYAAIKARDGMEPAVAAFMQRYELSTEQAVFWVRHLEEIWTGLEADYEYGGPTRDLDNLINGLLKFADNRLYWETLGSRGRHDGDFVAHVEKLMAAHPPP